MKIRQIRVHRLKSILRLEHSLYDDWMGQVVDGVMLIGPNGSGKSTLLAGLASLWEAWGDWLDAARAHKVKPVGLERPARGEPMGLARAFPLFMQPDFGLLAMELIGLHPERPVWLAVGSQDDVQALKASVVDAFVVAAVGQSRDSERRLQDWGLDWPGAPYDQSWLMRWAEARQRSLLGVEEMPNLIYFEPDNRQLLSPKGDMDLSSDLQDPVAFNWIARYQPTQRRAGHLNSMLYRMQITHPAMLETILQEINLYLTAKKLTGFSPSGDLQVVTGASNAESLTHLVYDLSSGERQIFIFLTMLYRWLHPGGIVLIDEPELHLHPSLRSALLARLQHIVLKQQGQMLFTSQSERMWKDYSRPVERIELGNQAEVGEP